jgi:hypothetical protein
MNAPRILLTVVALLAASVGSAWAGGRVYGGVAIGVGGGPGYWGGGYYGRPYWGGGGYYGRPYWGGGYYGSLYFPGPYLYPSAVVAPYYDAPSVVVVPAQPQVYIEQGAAVEQAPESSQYWYYCRETRNYYPYVKECPGGWQKVPPRPAQ